MGTHSRYVDQGPRFDLLAWDDYDTSQFTRQGYRVISQQRSGLSLSDRVQLALFAPVYPRFFSLFTFAKD